MVALQLEASHSAPGILYSSAAREIQKLMKPESTQKIIRKRAGYKLPLKKKKYRNSNDNQEKIPRKEKVQTTCLGTDLSMISIEPKDQHVGM